MPKFNRTTKKEKILFLIALGILILYTTSFLIRISEHGMDRVDVLDFAVLVVFWIVILIIGFGFFFHPKEEL